MMRSNSQSGNAPDKWTDFWSGQTAAYKAETTASQLLRFVDRYIGKRVLDVGAANGALIKAFQAKLKGKGTIVGIDSAPRSPEVEKADATALPFQQGEFDTVFMTDIVEHLDDEVLIKAMEEAMRVLKPGGHLIIATVNNEDLRAQAVRCPECTHWFHRWGHCRTFTGDSLGQLLRESGCEPVWLMTRNLGYYALYGWMARLAYLMHFERVKCFQHFDWHADLVVVGRK